MTAEYLELTEYETAEYPRETISEEAGNLLRRRFSDQVSIEYPTPWTDHHWRLRASGWVGYIPLGSELGLAIQPKVKIRNLFRMLEYAYRLRRGLEFPEGLIRSDSIRDYFESLAHLLAKRILNRARRGLYRSYVDQQRSLQYVRGRLDVRDRVRAPWSVALRCEFDEHTADIEDNQILAWTLYSIARSLLCTDEIQRDVQAAYRALAGAASVRPQDSTSCVGRTYNRLNDDYEPLHALCRFFLEHSGPTHEIGDRTMLPFLADMARVFELFVAEWLDEHLPERYAIRAQEPVAIDRRYNLKFQIDLVLRDRELGRPVCVLDTKYKKDERPSTSDFSQIVVYAKAMGCTNAALVYPARESASFETVWQGLRLSAFAVALEDQDIEHACRKFMDELLNWVDED